ncbi:Leucine aminopeptidase [Fasciolopsis buskii]|uniref:Leucine aminopeptidase n=1 Tax=Fasciolopsis buskii TaxID=27845 RepID=A0A8E0RLV2_9TREM|nr:Leucine aminopeptidase [Fasciolopsis buski]
MDHLPTVTIEKCLNVDSPEHDAVVLVAQDPFALTEELRALQPCLQAYSEVVKKFDTGVHLLHCDKLPSRRLLVSLTGPLDRDYDDVRRITEATKEGVLQAVKVGSTKPLLALTFPTSVTTLHSKWAKPEYLCLATVLAALGALYVPLEVREFSECPRPEPLKPVKSFKAERLGWLAQSSHAVDHDQLIHLAWCIEEGRRVARDIGGSDPERMCPSKIVSYLKVELSGDDVLLDAQPVHKELYPLAAVVDRGTPRDQKRSDLELQNLFLVGKGIVYDSGGHDLKVGGNMVTMHRDKCGAAAVAGFFKVLSLLKPSNINVSSTFTNSAETQISPPTISLMQTQG